MENYNLAFVALVRAVVDPDARHAQRVPARRHRHLQVIRVSLLGNGWFNDRWIDPDQVLALGSPEPTVAISRWLPWLDRTATGRR